MPKSLFVRVFAIVVLAIAVVAGVLLYTPWGRQIWQSQANIALIGGPFHLIDQNGQPRSDSDFRGQYLLVFFGFTNCPDVCPTTLNTVTNAMDKLGSDAAKVTPLFITVDPERDTPAVMKAYAANFTPRLVALSGSPDAIAAAAKLYRIYYKKVGEGADYSMDHTALLYLMGPDGNYLAPFSPDATADDIVKDLRQRF